MSASVSGSVSGTWPAEAAAVPAARHMVRDHLRAHGEEHLRDDAELLVSELVGNVVLHVGGAVTVTAHLTPGELLLEVRDGSAVSPALRHFSSTSSTGRGMRLVHALSATHGVRVTDSGKTVWVRLTAGATDRGDEELASEFAEVDWAAQLSELTDGDPVSARARPDERAA